MAGFSIRLLDGTGTESTDPRLGRLRLGDHVESFEVGSFPECPVVDELPEYWRVELVRFSSGAPECALRVNGIELWIAYRDGEDAVWQNQLIIPGWDGRLGSSGIVEAVPPRVQVSDGQRVSEWRTRLADLEEFLREERE